MLQNFNQWRPLQKFMSVCGIFAAILTLTLCAGELIIRKRLPNQYKFKHEWLLKNSSKVSTLILGSSQGFFGIKPDLIGDSVFNLANESQNFQFDNILLRHYDFPNLKTVILPVSYSSFSDPRIENSSLSYLISNYKIYMDIDVVGDYSKYNFELSQFFIYSRKLRNVLGDVPMACDSLGFGTTLLPVKKKDNWDVIGSIVASHHTSSDNRRILFHLGNLKQIADFCKTHGIHLIMVTLPAWKTYRSNLDRRQVEMVRHLADSIARADDFKYLYMLDDPRFIEEDFHDVNHLNILGAKKFTKIIRDTIKL